MTVRVHSLLLLAAACGGSSTMNPGADGSTQNGDAPATPADASDTRPPDPNDPVVDVPPYQGAYSFAKLTTQDNTQFADSGTWFTNDTTEHRVTTVRAHVARYRDQVLLQDKNAAQVFVYDQVATTVGAAIALPSDAVGRATIRGGLVYIGGLGKVYSYEVATQMWRSQMLPGAGTCHHVAAGKTRLFVTCADPSSNTTQQFYSTWANKTMSDVVPLGAVSPAEGTEFSWLTAAPGQDVAYFPSRSPDISCIGTLSTTKLDACTIPVRSLGTLQTAYLVEGQAAEDGASLYVTLFTNTSSDHSLYEIKLPGQQLHYIRTVDSFATCPDNSVVFQDFTVSQRYAGGVTTDVRLGTGGTYDMGCPLKPL